MTIPRTIAALMLALTTGAAVHGQTAPRIHNHHRTTATVTLADITETGHGDDTGPGGGGTSSATLDVPQLHNALGLPTGAQLHVRVLKTVSSAQARNGDVIDGVLVSPIGTLSAGMPVQLTVVAAAKAGQMTSAGELSVQVVSIAGKPCLSNVITATGQEGKRFTEDAAPLPGTEATLTPDQPLTLPVAL